MFNKKIFPQKFDMSITKIIKYFKITNLIIKSEFESKELKNKKLITGGLFSVALFSPKTP
jgi:hypothetical protein